MAGTVSVLAKSLCAISGSPEITNKGSSFFLRGALRATFRLYEWKTMVTIEINAQHTLLHKPVSGISAPTFFPGQLDALLCPVSATCVQV